MKDKAPGLFPIANQCLSLGHGHWVKLSPKSYCYRRFGLLYALEATTCEEYPGAPICCSPTEKAVGSSRDLGLRLKPVHNSVLRSTWYNTNKTFARGPFRK